MPELPEVETVVNGLRPYMDDAIIDTVITTRPNLRYPFPENLPHICEQATILSVSRRSKYILIRLSSGWTLVSHLGMSGTYTIHPRGKNSPQEKHDHCIITLTNGTQIIYNDPRRFGFILAVRTADEDTEKHLSILGVEPFEDTLTPAYLHTALSRLNTPIKTALLNQSIIAGLGNIYVCEALYRSKIHPSMPSKSISKQKITTLTHHITQVISDAIQAGGSSLKDFQDTHGKMGYFQHAFDVYGRENAPCHACNAPIQRIQQSGRSTFFCNKCQKKT